MKIAHPFVVQILNKQDTHPLQAASDLSGEKMVELRGVVGNAREALTSFAESALVSKGMIVDLAIHEAHIIDVLAPDEPVTLSRTGFLMCTTRPFEGGVFVNKTRQWNDRNQMLEWRKEWFLELAKHMPDRATANLSQEAKDLWRFIERFTGAKEQPQSPPTHTTAPDLEMAEIVEPPKRMRL
jgi:hypothetical protein